MKNTAQLEPKDVLLTGEGSQLASTLERSYMEAYLQSKGYSLEMLHTLTPELRHQLMVEASREASGRLAEMETRAHLVGELHKAAQAALPGEG